MNDLALQAKNDPAGLLLLWQSVSRLAYRIALKYKNAADLNGAVDVDDLKQCAFLGFLEALEGFDPLMGTFSTYMVWHIRNACRRLLGLQGRERREHYHTDSLDAPLPGTEDLILADTIPDESAANPFEQAELRQDVDRALHRLPDSIAAIIRLHDLEGLTLEEAAARVGHALPAARNLRRVGFRQLRQDRGLRAWHEPVRLRYKGVQAFRSDWTSVVEAEVIRRMDG